VRSGAVLPALALAAAFCAGAASDAARAEPSFGEAIASAALAQVGITTHYDPAYTQLSYTGGDVPAERGVCTDVVIRALRAQHVDLQQLVHEDMRAHFAAYPREWGLRAPDRNIDHRRVLNLQTYFQRRGFALPLTREAGDYETGDIVAYTLPGGPPHIGVVAASRTSASSRQAALGAARGRS